LSDPCDPKSLGFEESPYPTRVVSLELDLASGESASAPADLLGPASEVLDILDSEMRGEIPNDNYRLPSPAGFLAPEYDPAGFLRRRAMDCGRLIRTRGQTSHFQSRERIGRQRLLVARYRYLLFAHAIPGIDGAFRRLDSGPRRSR
jgi:hypothetical protein